MNDTTPLNTELLSSDARGRKHIPVAVFAVILIHVILFLVLLIAAGCRSSARAKRNIPPATEAAQQQELHSPAAATPVAVQQPEPAQPAANEQVTVSEPPAQKQPAPERRVTQKAQKATVKPQIALAAKVYVVKSGDTLEKIAKRHGLTIQAVRSVNKIKTDTIYAGQRLQIAPGGSTPLQVRAEQKKGAKEV